MMSDKKLYLTVRLIENDLSDHGYNQYIDTPENVVKQLTDMFEDAKPPFESGVGYAITPRLMTVEEFEALPEFEGF